MLKQIIIEKIIKEGPITFEKFMEMALYYPEFGYYMRRDIKIGKRGDFYTSTNLHPAFGRTILRQIEEFWTIMDKIRPFYIIEYGGGEGYLAKDILDYAKNREIGDAIRYSMLEINPYLMERQMELLRTYSDILRWYKSIDEIEPFYGCVISNELLDSFPVHLISGGKEPLEVYLDTDGENLIEILLPCGEDVIKYLERFDIRIPLNYRTEVNLRIHNWLSELSEKILGGFILTIDYGYPLYEYYAPFRKNGTLQCYYKHTLNEDPYSNIGEQDITAHVNFTALRVWAEEYNFSTCGYTTQGRFLVSLGIDEVLKEYAKDEREYPFEVAKIKSLILPQGMGESHKVMIHSRGMGYPKLRGFRLKNELYLL